MSDKPKYASLAEAIRAGVRMTPTQATGDLGFPGERTCALGAAFEAAGMAYDLWYGSRVAEFGEPLRLARQIVELNDTYHFTREEIADILDLRRSKDDDIMEIARAKFPERFGE